MSCRDPTDDTCAVARHAEHVECRGGSVCVRGVQRASNNLNILTERCHDGVQRRCHSRPPVVRRGLPDPVLHVHHLPGYANFDHRLPYGYPPAPAAAGGWGKKAGIGQSEDDVQAVMVCVQFYGLVQGGLAGVCLATARIGHEYTMSVVSTILAEG